MRNAASSSFGQEIGKLEIMEGHFLHTLCAWHTPRRQM